MSSVAFAQPNFAPANAVPVDPDVLKQIEAKTIALREAFAELPKVTSIARKADVESSKRSRPRQNDVYRLHYRLVHQARTVADDVANVVGFVAVRGAEQDVVGAAVHVAERDFKAFGSDDEPVEQDAGDEE